MYQFILNNWHTLLIIYAVGFVLTFIGTMLFFHWIGAAEDEERELYPEAYSEESAGTLFSWIVWVLLSLFMSVLWMAAPLMFMGLWLLDAINKKFPSLMVDDGEESEEENERD